MNTQIREIFNDTLMALNLTIIDAQVDSIFRLINRKYFSIVKPLSKEIDLSEVQDFEYLANGVEIVEVDDIFSLNIGDYKVFEILEQGNDIVRFRTEPQDYENYKLRQNYTDTYQTVCEAILERFEGLNMQTLKGIGVGDIENRMDINYEAIEQMLYKKHHIMTFELTG